MKKCISVFLAMCMALSMCVSASAYSDRTDALVIDWSQVDTSMLIPGVPYHRSARPEVMPLSTSERQHFLAWIYNVPQADPSGLHTSDKTFGDSFKFSEGDTGCVNVSFIQSTPSVDSVNIAIFDITEYEVADWVTVYAGKTEQLYVDLDEYGDDNYKMVISHNSAYNTINARVKVTIAEE